MFPYVMKWRNEMNETVSNMHFVRFGRNIYDDDDGGADGDVGGWDRGAFKGNQTDGWRAFIY